MCGNSTEFNGPLPRWKESPLDFLMMGWRTNEAERFDWVKGSHFASARHMYNYRMMDMMSAVQGDPVVAVNFSRHLRHFALGGPTQQTFALRCRGGAEGAEERWTTRECVRPLLGSV